jgi:hypothetical protein
VTNHADGTRESIHFLAKDEKLGSATLLVAFLFIFFFVVLPLATLFGLLLARLALVMLSGLSTVLTLSWLARLTTLLAGLSTLLTLLFYIVTHELPSFLLTTYKTQTGTRFGICINILRNLLRRR